MYNFIAVYKHYNCSDLYACMASSVLYSIGASLQSSVASPVVYMPLFSTSTRMSPENTHKLIYIYIYIIHGGF